ncbi:MFS transporter [Heyndrickxia sp. NPDC080065]|uniref:MFS transporter n=1 Tax=Heyndrickxia sp. NPDC080065 TaxID=3390568 RepID=UPI003D02318F
MLKERNFSILWLGQLVSIFGSRFSELVIPWIVLQVTNSPIKASIVAISMQMAPLLFSLPAGVWVENHSKKKIAMVSELARMIMMSLLVMMIFLGHFNLFVISSILFVSGIAGLLFRISMNTILPGIAGRTSLVEAHNYMEAADAISTLLGPLLAGVVLSYIGAAATLSIDAASFLISFISISVLTFIEREPSKRKINKKSLFKQGLSGVKYLFSTKIQRFITFNHIVLNFTTQAVSLLVIVLAKQDLQLSPTQIGFLLSGAGWGNLIGIFLMHHLKDIQWNKLYGSIMLASGCGIFIVAHSTNMWVIFLGMFVFDGALSMAFVINGAARQTLTPDQFLARVSSGGILLSSTVVILANSYAGIVSERMNSVWALLFCACILFINSVMSFVQKKLKKPLSSFAVES